MAVKMGGVGEGEGEDGAGLATEEKGPLRRPIWLDGETE